MNTEQERAEFEALMGKRHPDVSLEMFATGCYLVSEARHHWEGWQARAALQSQDREEWMRRFIELVDDFGDEAMLYGHPREADRSDMDKARAALIDHARRIEGEGE